MPNENHFSFFICSFCSLFSVARPCICDVIIVSGARNECLKCWLFTNLRLSGNAENNKTNINEAASKRMQCNVRTNKWTSDQQKKDDFICCRPSLRVAGISKKRHLFHYCDICLICDSSVSRNVIRIFRLFQSVFCFLQPFYLCIQLFRHVFIIFCHRQQNQSETLY